MDEAFGIGAFAKGARGCLPAYYSPRMDAARPRERRRRARRGTVDRPLNARLVRVAFLVVLPPLLALLFSISTAGTLPRPALEPLFDTRAAAALAAQLSTEYPSRVPGTVEAAGAARWYAGTIADFGFATEEDTWVEAIPDLGEIELHNLVTVVPGRSEESIVLVAHRDNAGTDEPLGDNASGTAALIEVARGFAPRGAAGAPLPQRTLVLVSTDAGAYGGAGAVRFANVSPFTDTALAVIVLDGLGGRGRPRLAIAGDASRSPAPRLVTTAAARVREQTGVSPALPSVLTQLVDLGIPYAAGEQGPFLARDVAAVTLTTEETGDPDIPAGDPDAPLAVRRLGQLGRATEALVGSIDASVGAAFRAPDGLFLDGRAASGWTVRLTLVIAVVPFALGALDLLVRSRRRRLPLAPALRGLRARILFWLYAGSLLWVGSLTGVFPTGASLPFPPYASFLNNLPVAGLLLLAIALALGWLLGRRRLVPTRDPSAEERLAGYAVALAWLAIVAVLIAVLQPYGLVFVLPSLYAWLWLPLRARPWTRAALYGAGLAGPVVGLLGLSRQLSLALLDTPLYVAGLATVGYIPLSSVLLTLAWAAAAAQLAALAFGRYAPYAAGAEPPPPGPVRASVRRVVRRARHARAYDRTR
jgi:hypothetical protein